ncbi:hypothetical protein J3F84DRAFT_370938 [Trichoderma pleuroticola]
MGWEGESKSSGFLFLDALSLSLFFFPFSHCIVSAHTQTYTHVHRLIRLIRRCSASTSASASPLGRPDDENSRGRLAHQKDSPLVCTTNSVHLVQSPLSYLGDLDALFFILPCYSLLYYRRFEILPV